MSLTFLPIINDCLCGNISRQNFIKSCLPFLDMETYNSFLLYEYKGMKYSINNPNSFIVKNNCIEKAKKQLYVINFENNSISYTCMKKNNIVHLDSTDE